MATFDSAHLNTFLALPYTPQPPVGRAPHDWAKQVDPETVKLFCLPSTQFCRSDLRQFCHDPENSTESCFISVMAWGGMGVKNGRLIWKAREFWIPTLDKLRSEELGRQAAFDRLKKLRDNEKLPGMRAPYFTKLIFFLLQSCNGYIMDRWTARSINLLCNRKIVKINSAGYVANENDGDAYESFCSFMDALAARYAQMGFSRQNFFRGDQAEELLFAKPRSEWRKYLNKN